MAGQVERHTAPLQAEGVHHGQPVARCAQEAVQQQHRRLVAGAARRRGCRHGRQHLQQAEVVAAAGSGHVAAPPLGTLPGRLLRRLLRVQAQSQRRAAAHHSLGSSHADVHALNAGAAAIAAAGARAWLQQQLRGRRRQQVLGKPALRGEAVVHGAASAARCASIHRRRQLRQLGDAQAGLKGGADHSVQAVQLRPGRQLSGALVAAQHRRLQHQRHHPLAQRLGGGSPGSHQPCSGRWEQHEWQRRLLGT